jgi:hypothetical protein
VIKLDIRPRQDDLYDIYLHDGNNDEPLLHSSQGYDGPGHPEDLARRLFERPADQWNDDDPVILRVTYRDGTSKTERIR